MRFLRRFLNRVVNLATRRAQDERLREEIEEHIALQTAENLRAGDYQLSHGVKPCSSLAAWRR
jgi:hypothetical protein